MKENLIDELAKEIVEKLSKKLNINEEMKAFLLTNISKENKEKTLEQLYLFQLYSNAYLGPDPRWKANLFSNALSVLKSKSDEELIARIEELKRVVELLKNAEINPLSTMERKLKDKENYKKEIF